MQDFLVMWDRFYHLIFGERTQFADHQGDLEWPCICLNRHLELSDVISEVTKRFSKQLPILRQSHALEGNDLRKQIIVLGQRQFNQDAPALPDGLRGLTVREGLLWFLFYDFCKEMDLISPVIMLGSRFPESCGRVRSLKWIPALSFGEGFKDLRFYPVAEPDEMDGLLVNVVNRKIVIE